jgi:glycosyltransferase 2 family protein
MEKTSQKISFNGWTLLRVLISVGLIVWLAFTLNWTDTFTVMRKMSWIYIGLAYLLLLAAQMLSAARLHILLRTQNIRIKYLELLELSFAGLFASLFLPGTVGGDVYKLIRLIQKGHSKAAITSSLVADRALGPISMIVYLPLVFFVPKLISAEVSGIFRVTGIFSLMTILLFIGTLYVVKHGKINALLNRFIERLNPKRKRLVNKLVEVLKRWLDQPIAIVKAFALTIILWFIALISGWLLVTNLNLSVTFFEWIVIKVLIYFATLIPISLNGLGVAEVSMVYLMGNLGVTPEDATAIAVVTRAIGLLVSLPGLYGIVANKDTG